MKYKIVRANEYEAEKYYVRKYFFCFYKTFGEWTYPLGDGMYILHLFSSIEDALQAIEKDKKESESEIKICY